MTSLEQSYEYCVGIARKRAKNFYYSFLVLPKSKRLAMCAVYAFMRECDDRSDEAGATETALVDWREQMDQALNGDSLAHPLWPAFADTVNRFCIPRVYLYDMIDGVTAAATGAIVGAVYVLGRRALVDVGTWVIFAVTFFVVLRARKIPEPLMILAAGIAGILLTMVSA